MNQQKYLIIDKHQRIELNEKHTYAVRRIQEEIENTGNAVDIAYYDEIEILYSENSLHILAKQTDVSQYDFIIFRGHRLDDNRQYQIKRMIIDYINYSKTDIVDTKIQNANAIINFPYYNKIYLASFCYRYDLPYFDSYFRIDGDYHNNLGPLSKFPIIAKEYGGANALREIDGKKKVKKNVYKIDKIEDFNQKYLRDEDLGQYFIQEFSPTGEDFRIFVSKGCIVGGWKREATRNFKTVSKGRYTAYNSPEEDIAKLAEKTAKAFKADFIAVDVMRKADNKAYIQEISFNPGFKAYETKIKGNNVNLAKIITESF